MATPFPVVFENLSFAYPSRPDQNVLESVNLRLEAGTSTAIVGRSGSGKSTLACLLPALYPPRCAPGTLTFAGHAWSCVEPGRLRQLMGIVPQSAVMVPASLRDNIAYGLPASTALAQSEDAAKHACIHDFASSLPAGYATVVGDGGVGLSGGQAQRIGIARALMRAPKLLILDEPTSNLDGSTASVVRDGVAELLARRPEMSVLIITHDPDMMRAAQRICVLDRGRVVQQGCWEDLMGSRGVGGALAAMMGRE